MKDEEKAEAYIRENVCNKERVFGSQSVCSDKAIRECNECGNFCYFAKINRKSYLDGFAEGREKWHDLRKNPYDLPSTQNYKCNQDGDTCWYDEETDQWLDIEGTRIKVIAWCELPQFKDKE